ncbi:hypothetical protein [Noviherbaspirillum sp.]|uniref:hypothetical protein n=1 Tax=Noviherbaspirillum sp. TaxID=1926288 RepID=UPI002FDF4075
MRLLCGFGLTFLLHRSLRGLAMVGLLCTGGMALADGGRFDCGGQTEAEIWSLWDREMRGVVEQRLLRDRLAQGDVYALYDLQSYTQSLVAMARRCGRAQRLLEIAALARTAYDALEPGTAFSRGRRWVCRGGEICNRRNKLGGTEVMLTSVQFLGMTSALANALAVTPGDGAVKASGFLHDTIDITVEHLLRWGDDKALDTLRADLQATPADVRPGVTTHLFTDKSLWMIAIYAELAGAMHAARGREGAWTAISDADMQRMTSHIGALLALFGSRISFHAPPNTRAGNGNLADLDRGFWRLYKDSRYAGYEEQNKPVECRPDGSGKFSMQVRVPDDTVPVRKDTGWDLSHARRLVPALDALERNRQALMAVFRLTERQLPPTGLAAAFAGTLVAVVWNGDMSRPLFTNYLSGANGWYRVAYDNGTGQCREGQPPYGLSRAFAFGGYAAWARHQPILGTLGRRLLELADSDPRFIEAHYDFLLPGSPRAAQGRLMFLPSLVGTDRP